MKDSNVMQIASAKATGTNRPVNRLGRGYLYDQKAGRSILLPDQWRIYQSTERAWTGGSLDGELYLHIERLPSVGEPIPTIWAEEDLDLYICSVAPVVAIGPEAACIKIEGAFSGKNVHGALAKVQISTHDAYLVLVITDKQEIGIDLNLAVRNIAERMLWK